MPVSGCVHECIHTLCMCACLCTPGCACVCMCIDMHVDVMCVLMSAEVCNGHMCIFSVRACMVCTPVCGYACPYMRVCVCVCVCVLSVLLGVSWLGQQLFGAVGEKGCGGSRSSATEKKVDNQRILFGFLRAGRKSAPYCRLCLPNIKQRPRGPVL